jgi:hypothetical protein
MITLPIKEVCKQLQKQEKTGSPYCLPPHLTHLMQHLDVSLIFSLTICYDAVLTNNRVVTMCHVSSMLGEAYFKAAHQSWPLMVPTSVVLFHFIGIFSVTLTFLLLKLVISRITLRNFHNKQKIWQKQ